MGAPGILIPAEVPSSHLPSTGFDVRGFADLTGIPKASQLLGEEPRGIAVSSTLDNAPHVGSSRTEELLFVGIKSNEPNMGRIEKNQAEVSGHENLSDTGRPSEAENINVKNVSKYVMTAAKNPEFAQKLHAVLLESGASPPPDLFSDMNQQDLGEQKVPEQVHPDNRVNLNVQLYRYSDKLMPRHGQSLISLTAEDPLNNIRCDTKQGWPAEGQAKQQRETEINFFKSASFPSDSTTEGFVVANNRTNEKLQMGATVADTSSDNTLGVLGRTMHGNQIHESSSAVNSCQLQPEDALVRNDKQGLQLVETFNGGLNMSCNGYDERIHPVLGEVAEWEIPWEDLQIGERIGIGKTTIFLNEVIQLYS